LRSDNIIKREYPDRPISAVAAIIKYNSNLLLVKKNSKDDIWSFPGGAVELGETLEAALIREVLEETRINIEILSLVKNQNVIRFDENKKVKLHYVLSIYEGKYISGIPKFGDDVIDASWHKISDLNKLKLIDGAIDILDKYL
jgi:8-oxo-dGTP diphosphatase